MIHPNQYSWILDWMTCFAICFPCFLSYPTEYNSSHRDVSKRESHQFTWLEKKRSKQRLFAQQKNRRITIVLSRWKDAIKESKDRTIHKIRAEPPSPNIIKIWPPFQSIFWRFLIVMENLLSVCFSVLVGILYYDTLRNIWAHSVLYLIYRWRLAKA